MSLLLDCVRRCVAVLSRCSALCRILGRVDRLLCFMRFWIAIAFVHSDDISSVWWYSVSCLTAVHGMLHASLPRFLQLFAVCVLTNTLLYVTHVTHGRHLVAPCLLEPQRYKWHSGIMKCRASFSFIACCICTVTTYSSLHIHILLRCDLGFVLCHGQNRFFSPPGLAKSLQWAVMDIGPRGAGALWDAIMDPNRDRSS